MDSTLNLELPRARAAHVKEIISLNKELSSRRLIDKAALLNVQHSKKTHLDGALFICTLLLAQPCTHLALLNIHDKVLSLHPPMNETTYSILRAGH